MTQRCQICIHPKRLEIDKAIVRGGNHRTISESFGVSRGSVLRHRDGHLSRQLLASERARELFHSDQLAAEISSLVSRTKRILSSCEMDGEHGLSIQAINSLRETYKFICQIAAYIHKEEKESQATEQQQTADRMARVLSEKELEILAALAHKLETGDRSLDVVKEHLTTELVIIDDSPQPQPRAQEPASEPQPEQPVAEPEETTEQSEQPTRKRPWLWPLGLKPGHKHLPG